MQIFAGLLPFVIFWFVYNVARFDDPLYTGYEHVWDTYAGLQYSFYLKENPGAERFALLDVRNIPLHLYTIFLMPPQFVPDWSIFRPSPYGMSMVLSSPAYIYAFLVRRRDIAKYGLWLAIALISIPLLLHFTQGWVQYGYRFSLDFDPSVSRRDVNPRWLLGPTLGQCTRLVSEAPATANVLELTERSRDDPLLRPDEK